MVLVHELFDTPSYLCFNVLLLNTTIQLLSNQMLTFNLRLNLKTCVIWHGIQSAYFALIKNIELCACTTTKESCFFLFIQHLYESFLLQRNIVWNEMIEVSISKSVHFNFKMPERFT